MERHIMEGKVTLMDDEGKPLTNVDSSGDHDSENEVASVDNNMANFLALKKVGYVGLDQLEDPLQSKTDVKCLILTTYKIECPLESVSLPLVNVGTEARHVAKSTALAEFSGRDNYNPSSAVTLHSSSTDRGHDLLPCFIVDDIVLTASSSDLSVSLCMTPESLISLLSRGSYGMCVAACPMDYSITPTTTSSLWLYTDADWAG
ncbi:hypothetical protein Tco_0938465 [Tanacetum coccineum]|uniref:Uncharacterized protein n=1 Tax=Tanacetum coccineum TaxID=301880 RepID=A0ABQ5DH71_9ASTR